MARQSLPFSLRIAGTLSELQDACRIRAVSYGQHTPQLSVEFAAPDRIDADPDTAVFVGYDKHSGAAVGTIRVATNARGPLQIEQSTPLPAHAADDLAAEVTRLAILPEHRDPTLKLALMKAAYLYCLARQVRWMVAGARTPGLISQYEQLGFTDWLGHADPVPLAHAGGLPHRVLGFDVTSAERHWHAARHPFYDFMLRVVHPDIDVIGRSIASMP